MEELIDRINELIYAEYPDFDGIVPKVMAPKGSAPVLIYDKTEMTEDQLVMKSALRVTLGMDGSIRSVSATR